MTAAPGAFSAALRRAESRPSAPASIRRKASGLSSPAAWRVSASAAALSGPDFSVVAGSLKKLRPPIRDWAASSPSSRPPSASMSPSVSWATSNGSSGLGTSLAASCLARSCTTPMSRPYITAARICGSGRLRKRSMSGRLLRITSISAFGFRPGGQPGGELELNPAGSLHDGALLGVLLGGDRGVGLVGAVVGQLDANHAPLGQRAGGQAGKLVGRRQDVFVAGRHVVDADAARIAGLGQRQVHPIGRRRAAVLGEGVVEALADQ